MNTQYTLKTLGHATLMLKEDGVALIATDPWLIGSAYWRSWWLEKYPTKQEIEDVRHSENIYVTHSHPDHFHYPSLRHIGRRTILHPRFPRYDVPDFLQENGFESNVLEPWQWKQIGKNARVMSIPVPIDDSILIVETPNAVVINFNDSNPLPSFLRLIRDKAISKNKAIVVLKSYSPASIATSMYREGKASPMKDKRDYTVTARTMAEAVGATHFVPFASQVFFSRNDSTWANETKVTYEDLQTFWGDSPVHLCPPFVEMDLETQKYTSSYSEVNRKLDADNLKKVMLREKEEEEFILPEDCGSKLQKYLSEIFFLRRLFRRGIGWKLTTGEKEFFYNTRTGKVEDKIPENYDLIISLPDKVLYESLENNVMTDLGISMFIRVDTKVSTKFTYGFFLLMGLHDYGHFNSVKDWINFVRFYMSHGLPFLFRVRDLFSSSVGEAKLR
jgi:hypothetical protein